MEFIKSRLSGEVKKFLDNELNENIHRDRKEKIDLFDKFLCLSKDGSGFEVLNDTITNALELMAREEIKAMDLLNKMSITEQYIKSLIFLVSPNDFQEIMKSRESFKDAIIFIGQTKLNKYGNLDLALSEWDKNAYKTLENKFSQPKYSPSQLHWARAYQFRNEDAHLCKNYTTKKCYSYVYSIIYVLLESTWKYKTEIERLYSNEVIFEGINKKNYYNEIINEYESKNYEKTFVVMNSSKVDTASAWFSFTKDDEDENNNESLSDSIINIMEMKDNYIKLIGEAGLGKSRAMKQLQYNDAKIGRVFPIYIELKYLSDNSISLMSLIAEKSGLDVDACSLLMKRGGVHLYLDGVNEILCSDKNKRAVCSEIDDLANKYPKTKILVSDRESSQVTVRVDIPTYLLCKLDEPMIHEFISKNSLSKEYEERILGVLEKNKFIYDIVQTPFLLECFIKLIERGEYKRGITNENQLIEVFVKNLIYRELSAKKEVRADKIEMLLTYLFVGTPSLKDGRAYFSKPGILSRFTKCKVEYGFEVDTYEILEIIVQMGLLEKIQSEECYIFANEFYENYFLNKALLWVE